MTRTCLSPHCPYVTRLERTKACYRAQQAEIAALQEQLARYRRIYAHLGERRWYESEVRQRLAGTEILFQLTILRRAVQQRDAQIQHQAYVISALKALLGTDEVQPARVKVEL